MSTDNNINNGRRNRTMAFKNIADQTNGFYIPCVSLFGPGCAKEIGGKAQNLGAKKALIVTDAGLFKFGVADTIAGYLKDAGVDSHIFPGAEPNPTDINVHNGVTAYNDQGCDYEGIDKSTVPMTPLIAINTTAGTASEMTRFCIITNTDTHVKMAIVDWRCTPLIAIDDPKLMIAKPASLTAATGMDALTHAVEAYVSTAANPITDACAEKAISMISEWLSPAVANGENLEARDAMSYAQYLAGMAFNNASLGYVHAMAHQLGGFYNLPHGVCNAVLLPHVCEFNLIACPDRYARIAELMGVNTTGLTVTEAGYAAIDAIRELSASIGIPSSLSELGVKEQDLGVMSENAQKDACMLTNPRKANHAQVVDIFKAALKSSASVVDFKAAV